MMIILNRRVQLIAEQFVEPLRGRGQALEIVVIKRSRHRAIDHLHVNIIKHNIDRISLPAIGKLLAGKNDAIAVKQ